MGRGRRAGRVRSAEPQRRCVGCRQVRPQRGLLRIAAEDGKAVPGRANPGRGCYICRDPRCAQAAAKSGAIARALKGKAGNPPLEALLGWIQDRGLPLA